MRWASAPSPTARICAYDLAETTFNAMAELVDKPLINLESAINHPCQALADWKTMDDLQVPRNGRFVLSWVYHPRALPLAVPSAAVHMAAMRGMEVVVLRPEGFALPAAVMEKARRAAAQSGGSVRETADRDGSARRRARRLCQGMGLDQLITAMLPAMPGCGRSS